MGDWIDFIGADWGEAFGRFSWPARRWLADRLVGDHAYSKNVTSIVVQPTPIDWAELGAQQGVAYGTALTDKPIRIKPFDQETA